nr:MAG TPA: hypothetical protein [Caudoviricetes sp.]
MIYRPAALCFVHHYPPQCVSIYGRSPPFSRVGLSASASSSIAKFD